MSQGREVLKLINALIAKSRCSIDRQGCNVTVPTRTSITRMNVGCPTGPASVHLDFVRAIAAIGVLLNHRRDCLFVDYPQLSHHTPFLAAFYLFSQMGHQWVVVFFALSGYLVGGSVLRQIGNDRWSWGNYMLARLTRLYTVLIPALLIGGALDSAGLHLFGTLGIYGGHTGTHEITGGIAARLSLSILLGNYLFLQAIRVPVLGSNGPLWSLSYEFWYYVAFPLVLCAFWPKLKMAKRIISALGALAVLLFVGKTVALLGLIWLMGVMVHLLPAVSPASRTRSRMLLFAIVSLTVATLVLGKLWHSLTSDFILGAVVAALIYLVQTCSKINPMQTYARLARHGARSSYTLYLVHVPAVVFVTAWIGEPRWQPDSPHLLFALEILGGVIIYSQIVYFLTERNTDPIRNWLKLRLPKNHPGERTQATARL